MKDFGGLVRRKDTSAGRSRKAVVAVAGVVCLAVVVAWLAQGRIDPEPEVPAEERLEEAAAGIRPSLDPEGATAERYPGSPWERRNNMLQEIVTIAEREGDTYEVSEKVRSYIRDISPAIDESCAELLSLLEKDSVPWSGVVAHAGMLREDLLRRFDHAVSAWAEDHRRSLRGVKALFVCR